MWKFIIKRINLNNFNTINVNDMSLMFYECSSLKELNLNNFNTINLKVMTYMFYECSKELVKKIRNQYTNIKDVAFKY